MKITSRWMVLGICVCLSVTACKKSPAAADSPASTQPVATTTLVQVIDQSTPNGTMVLFARAMKGGDAAEMHKLIYGDAEKVRFIEAGARLMHARQQMIDAGKKKSGMDLTNIGMASSSTVPDTEAAYDETKLMALPITIDGDTAKFTVPYASDTPTNSLRLVNGKWMLDLSNWVVPGPLDQSIKVLDIMSSSYAQLTTEINEGKYKSAAEVKEAFDDNMARTMLSPGLYMMAKMAKEQEKGNATQPSPDGPATQPAR